MKIAVIKYRPSLHSHSEFHYHQSHLCSFSVSQSKTFMNSCSREIFLNKLLLHFHLHKSICPLLKNLYKSVIRNENCYFILKYISFVPQPKTIHMLGSLFLIWKSNVSSKIFLFSHLYLFQ